MMMKQSRIDEIRERLKLASPGPWRYVDNGFDGYISDSRGEPITGGEPCDGRLEGDDPNVQFIVNAHADISDLLNWLEKSSRGPENNPLTLEELREMDGEPVWVKDMEYEKQNRWCVLDGAMAEIPGITSWWYSVCDYGKTWIAYRHRPKEEAKFQGLKED